MQKTRKFSEGLLDDERILACLDIGAGQTILDAGCGSGYMALKFSQRVGPGGKVYALDNNEGFIANLRKDVENTNIEVLVGDITRPTVLEDASIDLVYLSAVFHIFSEARIEGFVKEVKRILKPAARLAIVNLNKEETSFRPSHRKAVLARGTDPETAIRATAVYRGRRTFLHAGIPECSGRKDLKYR